MTTAQELTTLDGIPLHPLVVHAVVVLLPLAAVGAIAAAARQAWRRRYGPAVLAVTALAVLATPIAQRTGEQLRTPLTAVAPNPLIARHEELGRQLLPVALGLGVALVLLLVAGRLADRERTADQAGRTAPADDAPVAVPRTWRRIALGAAVLVVVLAVATVVQVVRAGHSGSVAVWQGTGVSGS
ncbi:hypothetical protein LX15_006119 [Streptoalloteichus tenebrarius]|uniref:DUF2231 domain-containing protein n=1 Tax=Streptoalloteichus tenebrarius (strain ATCC 17920 / DSM 40477 / JCM 4838 / CBS 697.72 / NBRC 16177 / NCIMB 11028 / NRRL B-12390 / A12253. 1 / ISP 5477) TaxID=1933 RepID=A0ABT1I3N7_STRSD|nr:DUF2231 domain-containing protein [Streptoalloteichus tenebrarius]MCP2262382.1 hypothetical protein [Streptoalloteichus tenebrarius]BFF00842.1 hypothetical protein GCM10020241_25170 [Streptoalloteichus tenebrarius]